MGDNLDLPLIYTGRYFGFALFSCLNVPHRCVEPLNRLKSGNKARILKHCSIGGQIPLKYQPNGQKLHISFCRKNALKSGWSEFWGEFWGADFDR